jgi:hypothetical protein
MMRSAERPVIGERAAVDLAMETSSNSAGDSGGRIEGSRAASIDLPEPGGPLISRLCPPAAATSSARLALSCPLISIKSSSEPSASRTLGWGRDSTWLPLKWLASWISEPAATISISGLAHAASGPQAAGQIRPSPRPLAPIAAGSTMLPPGRLRCALRLQQTEAGPA